MFISNRASVRYDVVCRRGHRAEIEKPMVAGYPACPKCGAETRRDFSSVPVVHYAVAGFYYTDVTRFRSQVGPERFARFERQKADVLSRAAAGKLTAAEQALERTL